MEKSQCIFCKIVNNEVASYKVYEDKECVAVLDINPASKGHILLIPKKHYQLLPLMPDETFAHMGQVAKWLSYAAMKLLSAKGVSIFGATGGLAGQNAPHAMLHIIPRYENDKVRMEPAPKQISPDELVKLKQKLLPLFKQEFGGAVIEEKKEEKEQEKEPGRADLDMISSMLLGDDKK